MSNRRIQASLLSLPDELLSAIFSEVARDLDGFPDPRAVVFVSTCRRLAPIVRQEVYRKLWIGHSSTETRLLSELCAKRPDLRALVQDLHCVRTMEIDHHGYGAYIDFGADHPGNVLLRSYFPALHTLSVVEATPADISNILSRVYATTRPAIRKLILGCASDPQLDDDSEHRETWWHLLARLPMLEDLTLDTTSFEFGPVRIVFDDARAFAPLQNLHSLTLNGSPWHATGGPTLAELFPNLKRLDCYASVELEPLLRHAPRTLTQLNVWPTWGLSAPLQPGVIARFPLLERLALGVVNATALLPSIRTSRIKYLRLSSGAELADQDLRSLVDGPARMKDLKALALDYISLDLDCWSERDLKDALGRDARYDLAQVKDVMHPEWPEGCSAEGLRAVMDAARKNGIEVYGTALECLDWNNRFDEFLERYLVNDALTSNDYTTIERYLGVDGASEAISRQRPRLAGLIRRSRT